MHRWLWIALLVFIGASVLGACGSDDSGGDSKKSDGGKDSGLFVDALGEAGCAANPWACSGLGAECGLVDDTTCGGQRDCGSCPPGLTCGGLGAANKCGCQGKSCQDLARTCGIAADGCGGLIDCGTCSGGELCNLDGKCAPCQQGQPCAAVKPCVKSTMECGGTPKCVDAGFDPAGTACGPGLTCDGNGVCVCTPKSCSDLGVECGAVPDGCGGTLQCPNCTGGQVCNATGQCVSCTQGAACQASAPCLAATMECGSGTPTCKDNGNAPLGAPCGVGFQCDGQGHCVCKAKACSEIGKTCGSWSDGCGGSVSCGTCSANQVCSSSGQCVACVQGASCAASSSCKTGSVDCGSGAAICKDTGNVGPGISCGPGYVCNGSGSCIACAQGTSCSTGAPCQNGSIDCTSGSPSCTATGNKPNGTPCGAGMVCTSGSCGSAAVCGNGNCESGETGSSCGQDCCDGSTACAQSKQNQGVLFCRAFSGGSYQWYTEAQGIGLCDQPSEICTTTYQCGGQSGTCAGIPGKYVTGPCPVCGDGNCVWPEDGTSCAQDCCDATTPCAQSKQNQNVLFCRSFSGGGYGWYSEAQGIALCDETSEICTATFSCGGQSGVCASIPGGWIFGSC